MRKFFILSLLSFSTFGGVAHADWKQTKWGMTVAQVQAKCPNAVAVSSDSETQRQYNVYNGDKTLLREENYKVGDMNYDVRFIFDENNRLKAINMAGDQYYYIRTFDLLSGKYGKPAVYSGNGGQLSSATWQVPDKHLVIKLLEIMSTQIRYEPMTDAL